MLLLALFSISNVSVSYTAECRVHTKFGQTSLGKQHQPAHYKTNKMACAPSEDSDQPGRPPSLIRVFAICMKKAWVLSYP